MLKNIFIVGACLMATAASADSNIRQLPPVCEAVAKNAILAELANPFYSYYLHSTKQVVTTWLNADDSDGNWHEFIVSISKDGNKWVMEHAAGCRVSINSDCEIDHPVDCTFVK